MAKTPSKPIPAPPPAPGVVPTPPTQPSGTSSDDVTTAQTSTSPPTPPVPPVPPAPGAGADTSTTAADTDSTTASEPVKAGDPPTDDNSQAEAEQKAREPLAGGDSENGPVTGSAELHGATLASDAQAKSDDDDDLASAPANGPKRIDAIRAAAFSAGHRGKRVGPRRKTLTDSEWAEYQTAHARGVAQSDADEMSVEDRLARIERTMGLVVPGAHSE